MMYGNTQAHEAKREKEHVTMYEMKQQTGSRQQNQQFQVGSFSAEQAFSATPASMSRPVGGGWGGGGGGGVQGGAHAPPF